MKPKLFLLTTDFIDTNADSEGKRYFCPQCAIIEGIIAYYPQLKNELEITYVDFKRPRNILVDLIGEDNQSCPVIVIDKSQEDTETLHYFKSYNDTYFNNSIHSILKYLAVKYGIALQHP